jgi:hypothetical protein
MAGPLSPEEETPPKSETGEPPDPVEYTAAANGVNGVEDSTLILFTFKDEVSNLKAGDISLANGGGDSAGRAVKGALAGSGKEWSLGVTVQNPGSVSVAINREDIDNSVRPVAVYKAGELIRIAYNAAADGGKRQASTAISFSFGAAIPDLAAEDITIAGDSGRVVAGVLTGSGQVWSLGIAVEEPGTITIGIAREDIEAGERSVTVFKPLGYTAEADGAADGASSAKIDLSFAAAISGLTAEDISLGPETNVAKGTLSGEGAAWSLGITALKAGDIQLSIHKDGIEDAERTVTLYFREKPISYTAAANGVNGQENSTAIVFTFDEDLTSLRAGQITLISGEGDSGGEAEKGALEGSGKEWSLGIKVKKAGSVKAAINRSGVETEEKTVTLYKTGEQTRIGFEAAADGGERRASSAIILQFGAAIADLTAEDIAVTNDTGSVTAGLLSGSGQVWSLGIAVETPGDLKLRVTRDGVDPAEKTLAVYKPATYSITTDGEAGAISSTKIDFSFDADIAGLTTGDITVSPADSVETGALSGGGQAWSLGIQPLKAGDIRVRINRDGIEDRERTLAIHRYRPVSYTAAANGANGTEDSTAIVFVFDQDIANLGAEHLSLENGTAVVSRGGLTGSGKLWTLEIAVEKAGSVRVAVNQEGVEAGERTLDVYKAAEQTLISFEAAVDGGVRRTSSAITLSFGEAVSLAGKDIVLSAGTGRATKGTLSGGGKTWTLGIVTESAGDIGVAVNKDGIETGEKTVTLHKPVSYEAAADITAGAEPSTRINFVFSEAVEGLSDLNLRFVGDTIYPMQLSGSGQAWSLAIVTIKTGTIKIGIDLDGIDDGERTVAVYKPPEAPPEVAVKTGITVTSPPDITLYAKNQSFDPAGLEVAWVYSDGTLEPTTAYQIDPPNMAQATVKMVNVRAGGYTAGFYIQVLNTEKALVSISVEGPANMTQDVGREFDRTGLKVTGHYSDNTTSDLTSLAGVYGYNKSKRGSQDVSIRVNGKTAALPGISTRIGEDAAVSINAPRWAGINNMEKNAYKNVYIKGEALTPESWNIRLLVGGGTPVTLSYDNGSITAGELAAITGYNPYQTGKQTLYFTLDGRNFDLEVIVIDTESEVWFDYGYARHAGDPGGAGKDAGINEGKYYAKPGETLILTPIRYLVGYNADHSDAGASYAWTVSGGSWTAPGTGEFLHFTPSAAGTYDISVSVTGRSYVTGGSVTKTASTKVVCFDNNPPQVSISLNLKNFGPGQMAELGATGYGWSAGSAGGYWVWGVEHRPSYKISGNAMSSWHEAGVVWAQEDRNGNGRPDETWYELKGGDENDPAQKNKITRRYALRYFEASGGGNVNEYGQTIRELYWTDSKGRGGYMPGGWPSDWGVTGNWVTYTCTLLRDDGNIATGTYGHLFTAGYVDALGDTFYLSDAMDLEGNPVTLTAVRFLKVQTAIFHYGGSFGDVSTEIRSADFLGQQTTFPLPEE